MTEDTLFLPDLPPVDGKQLRVGVTGSETNSFTSAGPAAGVC